MIPKFRSNSIKFLLNPKSWNFATRFRSGRGFACGGSGSPTANMTLIIDDHCDHVHEIDDDVHGFPCDGSCSPTPNKDYK